MTQGLVWVGLLGLSGGLLSSLAQCLVSGYAQRMAARASPAFLAIALLALAGLFCLSDTSIAAVAQHSHRLDPLLYKLAATWSHHEGSMVLWCVFMAGYGALFTVIEAQETSWGRWTCAIQGGLTAFFITYVLTLSNPFMSLADVPAQGGMLNPLLQDPAVSYHPPLLYLGYVGLSIPFSMGCAAYFRAPPATPAVAHAFRFFLLLPWTFLTLGITFGSLWAYYELGWGGWWFWDPVENVSILPWIAATAALHMRPFMRRGDTPNDAGHTGARPGEGLLYPFLLTLPFLLSFLGSTLVRSGALISVHSFAQDPRRGGVLALGWVCVASLVLFGAFRQQSKLLLAPLGPLGSLLALQQLAWLTIGGAILLGTLYPLVLGALGAPPVAVGAPFYGVTVGPFALLLLALLSCLPLVLRLKASAPPFSPNEMLGREGSPWIFSGLATLLVYVLGQPLPLLAYGAIFLSFSVLFSLLRLPPRWRRPGLIVAHAGVAVMALGIAVESSTRVEGMVALAPGETGAVGPYELTLESLAFVPGDNYFATRVTLAASRGDAPVRLTPERRYFVPWGRDIAETALSTSPFQIWYAAVGPQATGKDGTPRWPVRFYVHTLTPWIWVGGLLMALGGMLGCGLILRQRIGRRWSKSRVFRDKNGREESG